MNARWCADTPTRSSSLVTLARPSVSSSLQVTNRSFTYASPYLWNQLPSTFRQPHSVHCPPGTLSFRVLVKLFYRIVSYRIADWSRGCKTRSSVDLLSTTESVEVFATCSEDKHLINSQTCYVIWQPIT